MKSKEIGRAMFRLLALLVFLYVLVCKKGFLYRKGYCISLIVLLYFNSKEITKKIAGGERKAYYSYREKAKRPEVK